VHAQMGELARALADYDQALQIQPDSPATLVRRGDVYRQQGKMGLALADYAHAVRLNPRFDEAAQKLAVVMLQFFP
jgi:tetratricopeptide (TPR) repeat protein